VDNLTPQLQCALSHADVSWSEDRTARAWSGLRRKRVRRAAVRRGLSAFALALAVLGARAWWPEPSASDRHAGGGAPGEPGREVAPTPGPSPEAVALADGVLVTPLEDDAEVEVVESTAERVAVKVVRGRNRFQVPRAAERDVRVVAGDVTIRVYASEFAVARFDVGAEVWVYSGHLRIEWNGEETQVWAGEHRRFVRTDGPAATANDEAAAAADRAPESAPVRAERRWQKLAREGRFDDAYDVLRRAGADAIEDSVAELLLAADVARMSGHPEEALRPLRQVVTHHAQDSRAPLAAFTLGRVLLDDLRRPGAAAKVFARARELAPAGALAEDALAREVEAWSRAGNAAMARERAELYLQLHPRGHRASAVRQYGALE
jgi:transmembrane sensor